jgi:hypothetical protein
VPAGGEPAMTGLGTAGTGTADELWEALDRARTGSQPRTLAQVEDALFRYYLPMARSIAARHAPDHPDPDGIGQAAEVGLAQAILGWRHRGPAGFDRFAGSTITAQLRRHDTLHREQRRPRPGTGPPPEP